MSRSNSYTANTPIESLSDSALQQFALSRLSNKSPMLSLLLLRLFGNRITQAWERIRVIPLKLIRSQQRLKMSIEGVFRRQEYLAKWAGFQQIKREALLVEQREVKHLRGTLQKQRATAIRLLSAFAQGKKRTNFWWMIRQLKQVGNWRQFQLNSRYRAGIRAMTRVVSGKMRQTFSAVKDTRVIIAFVKKCRDVFRMLGVAQTRAVREAFGGIRREGLGNKKTALTEEVKELEGKLEGAEDEEMKGLKEKYQEYVGQLDEIKKEKDQINAAYEKEVQEGEARTKEMKETMEGLKAKQEQMKQRMVEIEQELKVPYTLEEIYQLCYENLLWYVSQHTEKTFSKQALLKSLQTPLVPIDLPLSQLKEENTVLRELLSEYVLMNGEKKLPENTKLELPYEYLLKENNLLYRMLMTLLPNVQFLRDEIHRVRESFDAVQESLKLMSYV